MVIYPPLALANGKHGPPLMYPENWFALTMLQHAMVYKIVEEAFEVLRSFPPTSSPAPATTAADSSSSSTHQSSTTLVDPQVQSTNPLTRASSSVGMLSPVLHVWRTAVQFMVMFLMSRALQVCPSAIRLNRFKALVSTFISHSFYDIAGKFCQIEASSNHGTIWRPTVKNDTGMQM